MMKKHVAALLLLCAALFALPVGAMAAVPNLYLGTFDNTNKKFTNAEFDTNSPSGVVQVVVLDHGNNEPVVTLKTGITKNDTASGINFNVYNVTSTDGNSNLLAFIKDIQFTSAANARVYLLDTGITQKTHFRKETGHFYQLYTTGGNWQAVYAAAQGKTVLSRGGYLLAVDNSAEQSFVFPYNTSAEGTNTATNGGVMQGSTVALWLGGSRYSITKSGDTYTYSEGNDWYWRTKPNGPQDYIFFYGKEWGGTADNAGLINTTNGSANSVGGAPDTYQNWNHTFSDSSDSGPPAYLGEPNNSSNSEQCLHAHPVSYKYSWNDYRYDNASAQGYVVEFGDIQGTSGTSQTTTSPKTDRQFSDTHEKLTLTYVNGGQYTSATFAYGNGFVSLPTDAEASGWTFNGWFTTAEAAYNAALNYTTDATNTNYYNKNDLNVLRAGEVKRISATVDTAQTVYGSWVKDVTGSISWADENNIDGHRPASVDLTLVNDSDDAERTVTLNGPWTNTWTNVPVYNAQGTEITYTVDTPYDDEQSSTNLYAEKISELTAKLTHDPETISFGGSVFWDDDSNRDGQREDVVVTLYKDSAKTEIVKTVTKPENAEDTVAYSFDALYQYKNVDGTATEIVYSANIEDVTTGYTLSKEDHTADDETENDERKLKLSYTPQVVPVTVTINWPEDDKDYRPDNVAIKWTNGNGLPSGTVLPTSIAKPAEDKNSTTTKSFNLYASASAAEKASYGIGLTVPDGYRIAENDTPDKTLELTLGNTQANVSFTLVQDKSGEFEGQIVWDDEEDQDGKRPTTADAVKALLTIKDSKGKDLTSTALLSVTPGAETKDNWTYKFTGLPTHYADGSAASYTVSAANYQQNGKTLYSASVNETDKKTITMAYGVLMVDLTVGVEFSDAASQTQAPRPETVTAVVKGSDSSSYSFMVPQTVEGVTTWSAAQEKPRYARKTAIDYTSVATDLVLTDDGQNNAAKGYSVTGPKVTDAYREIAQGDPETDRLSGRTFTYTLTPKTWNIVYPDGASEALQNGDQLPAKYTYGQAIELPTLLKEGYTYGGWEIYDNEFVDDPNNPDDKQMVIPLQDGKTIPATTVPLEGQDTIYVRPTRTPSKYTIVYQAYGGARPTGTEATNPEEFSADDWYGSTPKPITQDGYANGDYDFFGWYLTPDYSGELVDDIHDLPIANGSEFTLYAHWTADFGPYTAEWDDEDNQDGLRQNTVFHLWMVNNDQGGLVPVKNPNGTAPNFTLPAAENKIEGKILEDVTIWHDDQGNPISYTVEPDLSKMVDQFGNVAYTVEHTRKDSEDTEPDSDYFRLKKNIYMKVFTVRVVWEDLGNKYGLRPDLLNVELIAQGGEFEVPPEEGEEAPDTGNVPPKPSLPIEPDTTATLNAGNGWTANWWAQRNPEPRVVPLRYDVELQSFPPAGYVMTETLTENEKVITFTLNELLLPPTGDESNIALWGGLLALCVGGLGALAVMRRKRRA